MYAIVSTGGKQLRVKVGSRYRIEKLKSVKLNEKHNFNFVLLLNDGEKVHIGQPFVANAVVEAEVVDEAKGPKIRIVKMRRRKHSMTRTGHRQNYTWVKVTAIKNKKTAAKTKKATETKEK